MLHAAGLSLAVIAAKVGIGKATFHAIVKVARATAQAPATPAKPAKATGEAATGRVNSDMADPRDLKKVHGQRHLPAV